MYLLTNMMNSIMAFGFDDVANFVSDNLNVIGNAGDSIAEMILYNVVFRILYYLAIAFCKLIYILDMMLEAFTGARKVYYDGDTNFLTNVFPIPCFRAGTSSSISFVLRDF